MLSMTLEYVACVNFVKRLVDKLLLDTLETISKKIAPLGWHVVIYFEAQELPELASFFAALPTDVVVDHMGRPDVSQPLDGPGLDVSSHYFRIIRTSGAK